MTHFWRQELQSLGLGSTVEEMLRPPAAEPAPEIEFESEIVYEQGQRILEKLRPRVRGVREWAELNSAWADSVHEAADRDLERIGRRSRAEFWREHPVLAGLPGAS